MKDEIPEPYPNPEAGMSFGEAGQLSSLSAKRKRAHKFRFALEKSGLSMRSRTSLRREYPDIFPQSGKPSHETGSHASTSTATT